LDQTYRHGGPAVTASLPGLGTMAVVPVLLVLYGAIALCVIPVLSSGFNFERNYSEGWNAYHAFRAASGEVLYSGDPRHFVNYPFLSFYLIAWLKPLFGDVLTIGRALSLIALAVISGGSAVVVRQLGGRPLDALFAGACVLGYQVVQAPGWIGSDDPQMLAEACMIGGLAWYLHDRTTIWRLAVTAALLGIGGFTKHNLIAIPAAISFDILWNNRRVFWVWCCFAGATLLALTGLAYLIAGGDFLTELLAPCTIAIDIDHHAQKFAISFKLPLLIAIVFLARSLPRSQAALLRSWGIVSLASAVVFSAGEGTSFNIFLDVVLFFGIIAGLALQRWGQWLTEAGQKGRIAMILLPLVLAQPIVTRLLESTGRLLDLPHALRSLSELQNGFTAAARALRAQEGAALCESLLLCFEAGKPLLVDPYNARQMILTGRLEESALLDEIKQHRFAIIEMPTRIYPDAQSRDIAPYLSTPARFTENTLRAIEDYYKPVLDAGGVVFYRPKVAG
jgi:hypothetical protein